MWKNARVKNECFGRTHGIVEAFFNALFLPDL